MSPVRGLQTLDGPLLVEPHVHSFDAGLQVANVAHHIKHQLLELRALLHQSRQVLAPIQN